MKKILFVIFCLISTITTNAQSEKYEVRDIKGTWAATKILEDDCMIEDMDEKFSVVFSDSVGNCLRGAIKINSYRIDLPYVLTERGLAAFIDVKNKDIFAKLRILSVIPKEKMVAAFSFKERQSVIILKYIGE